MGLASKPQRAHMAMLFHALLISTSFPIATFLADFFPPLQTTFWRFSIAAILFMASLLVRHNWRLPGFGLFCRYALISLPLCLFFWLMYVAAQHTSALNMATLATSTPLITAFLSWLFWQQKHTNLRVFSLFVGMMGALLVIFRGRLCLTMDWDFGMSLFLLGCIFLAIYPLLLYRLSPKQSLHFDTTWILITGSLWALIAQLAFGEPWLQPNLMSTKALLWLAVASTMMTFFLFQYACLTISGDSAHAYGYLSPILVVLIGLFFGKPWPEAIVWFGAIMVAFALVLILIEDQKKASH